MKKLQPLFVCLPLLFICGCGASTAPLSVLTFSVTPASVAITPGESVQFTVKTTSGSAIQWLVNDIPNGNAMVGTVDSTGKYTAPSQTAGITVSVGAKIQSPQLVSAYATVHTVVDSGEVAATQHPQVARYTLNAPAGTQAFVQFGVNTNYGLETWKQSPSGTGGPVEILVAGMRAFTQYHMRGVIQFPDGTRFFEKDLAFTTGGLQPSDLPLVSAQTTPGKTPQPRVELVDGILVPGVSGPAPAIYATDLAANVLWWYKVNDGTPDDLVQPVQLMPNGHFLISIGPTSQSSLATPPAPGSINVLREIDLTGATIRELSIDDLNSRLATAGFGLHAQVVHHEALPLANGHWLTIVNAIRPFTDLPGFPGVTNVLGDDIVDLDASLQPVWIWSSFDHLDVNHHPMIFPDWTHANALVYLPKDGDLLLSMRHQNWILKIDYKNGSGTGAVLWKLGEGGDFKLMGGTDPSDWFYAQHGPSLIGTETPGGLSITVMDNGNDRDFTAGVTCDTPAAPPCQYSTGGVYHIDETAKTATLMTHYMSSQFSAFGGFSKPLPNSNIEFDFCATSFLNPTTA